MSGNALIRPVKNLNKYGYNQQMPAQVSEYHRLLKLTSLAAVVLALSLVFIKVVAWGMSGSISLLASLVDSLMDGAASLINLIAIRYALIPADDEHRFGHGKAESIAGLGQATFIAGSAIFLFLHAVDRFLHPRVIQEATLAVAVMGVSMVLTSLLLLLQRYTVAKTHSVAIKADSVHYAADLLSNLGIIAAIVLAQVGWQGFDPLAGIVIAVFIFYGAYQIGSEAIQNLLDRELPSAQVEEIIAIVSRDEDIKGVHEVRTRQSGPVKMIQMHIEMDGQLPLVKAHEIAVRAERALLQHFPGADVIIHQDPHGLKERHLKPGMLVQKP